jgi:hypothetical protein
MTDNIRRLEIALVTSLSIGNIPTEAEILELGGQLRSLPMYQVTDEEFFYVIGKLKESLRIDMGLGTAVVEDYIPWLSSSRASINFYYWERYRTLLHQEGLGQKVVNALDRVTDDILDLMGNPSSTSGWPRKGLVMGDVQSGKTSNYTGLICKSADSGYKLIILLTGTLESLRRQTQGRMDAGFVGLDSSGVVTRAQRRKEVGVGLLNASRTAGVFTSTLADFKASMVNQLGFRLKSINEPVLLVVKKNKKILENLTNWLVDFNANQSGEIDTPMLLIDDEADNASVNVNPEKATAINSAIRNLLKIFPRSSYVGFTATPFANIFINPETQHEMLGDDLFPKHFIYALEAPTNYLGATLLFGDDSPLNALRPIEDADNFFPPKHKSDFQILGVPDSLIECLRCFLIANAIMDLRRGSPIHRSMLVNVSHYTNLQNQVRDELDSILKQIQIDIRNFAGLPPTEAERNKTIAALRQTWENEFDTLEFTWLEVLQRLNNAVQPIEVRSVNQTTGSTSLDYSTYSQTGLRVIAVGGNSLSRGLTLEGLCTSYFYRSTQMYDTLLQMGRWFGYRNGYIDLVRIWMSNEAIGWYGHIAEASEELRREIRWMQQSRLKPIDFGLKVRAHQESLLITARNKMRHSQSITRVISVSNQLIETARIYSDSERISANYETSLRFLRKLVISEAVRQADNKNPLWKNVPRDLVAEFLESFIGHPLNVSFQPRDLADFVKSSVDDKMKEWDVVIPQGEGVLHALIDNELVINLEQRKLKREDEKKSLLVSEEKMRVGSRGVEREGLSKVQEDNAREEFDNDPEYITRKSIPDHLYRKYRDRPLLMLHFLEETEVPKRKKTFVPDGAVICALGLSFPRLDGKSEMVTYRVNLVELRNLLEADVMSDDDEDELEDDQNIT